ncbi:hypothetical protein MAXJ12_07499 [Mesorhizobium alhagi CCNWXJ12-2]|jgi:hypothetical protein|uniref:Uncharacterized protein n=1 Tax=Mesorhizobium alhagi CCNWXJ12-2 TaxID=1107882 RepID=H0HMY3_9HYPH|nr:hypothetical protein MAXJ12_07499 [Mesorhizobium alhagi CCNWXJ12-2]
MHPLLRSPILPAITFLVLFAILDALFGRVGVIVGLFLYCIGILVSLTFFALVADKEDRKRREQD